MNQRQQYRASQAAQEPPVSCPVVELPPRQDQRHEDQYPDQRSEAADQPRAGLVLRHSVVFIVGLLLLLVAGPAAYLYWDYAGHFESTDDAFIAARQFAIAPKVPGYITAVPVTDNQHVDAGDVIARIDDRDYRIALEQARGAGRRRCRPTSRTSMRRSTSSRRRSAPARRRSTQAQAALTFAQQQAARYQDLAQNGPGTVQKAQQIRSQLRQQQAALASAQAALKVAQRQIESLKAQRDSAEANLAQAKAQRDQAQLNLSYTTVTAAQAGRVVNLTAAVGQYAQPGTALTMFVPDEIWVTANFKETQLDAHAARPAGDAAIDAYPERAIRGHVASVQPGSGTAFSLLPAENATGNYVKIVQRVPVKIVMDNPPADVALGPGMSVVPDRAGAIRRRRSMSG